MGDDPLTGTVNCLMGSDLRRGIGQKRSDGEVVAGAVIDVLPRELFSAHIGGGDEARRQPIDRCIGLRVCSGTRRGDGFSYTPPVCDCRLRGPMGLSRGAGPDAASARRRWSVRGCMRHASDASLRRRHRDLGPRRRRAHRREAAPGTESLPRERRPPHRPAAPAVLTSCGAVVQFSSRLESRSGRTR